MNEPFTVENAQLRRHSEKLELSFLDDATACKGHDTHRTECTDATHIASLMRLKIVPETTFRLTPQLSSEPSLLQQCAAHIYSLAQATAYKAIIKDGPTGHDKRMSVLMAAAEIQPGNSLPSLIVVPKAVCPAWVNTYFYHFKKHELSIRCLQAPREATAVDLWGFQIIIASYDVIRAEDLTTLLPRKHRSDKTFRYLFLEDVEDFVDPNAYKKEEANDGVIGHHESKYGSAEALKNKHQGEDTYLAALHLRQFSQAAILLTSPPAAPTVSETADTSDLVETYSPRILSLLRGRENSVEHVKIHVNKSRNDAQRRPTCPNHEAKDISLKNHELEEYEMIEHPDHDS